MRKDCVVSGTFESISECPPPLRKRLATCGTLASSTDADQEAPREAPMMRVSMLRLFWSAFALACGIVPAFSPPPIPQDDSGSAPMRFEWRRDGPAHARGANCRVWISPIGHITAGTTRDVDTL